MATLAELQQQLAQAEQRYAEAQRRVIEGKAELERLKQAASVVNFQPLDTPGNREAFEAARARRREFENNQLEELIGDEGAAFSAVARLSDQIRQLETKQRAEADQGPRTDSAGETVAEAQEAKANGASSQSPADPAQKANAQGDITTAAASTVPSNADPATGTDSISSEAPNKLPEASLATSNGSLTNDAGTGPVSTVLQATAPNISAPEANNNLVSYIYKAVEVVSRFQQGRFTQEIQGVQVFFPAGPNKSTRADLSRVAAPNASTAPARPQTTVVQTATTPGALGFLDGGVTFQNQVGAEFGAFFGDGTTGESGQRLNPSPSVPRDRPTPGGSTFSNEGFVDPTQEQPDTIAPLKINPPTTDGGSVVSPPRRSRSNAGRGSQSDTTNTALQQGAREY